MIINQYITHCTRLLNKANIGLHQRVEKSTQARADREVSVVCQAWRLRAVGAIEKEGAARDTKGGKCDNTIRNV